MRLIIIVAILTTAACSTLEKQRRQANQYFDKHPGELATRCDKQFPVIDSVAEWRRIILSGSENMDYSKKIDSLVAIGDDALIQLIYAKKRADTISEQCADVVLGYMRDVESLQRQIKSLKNQYQPCSPDTVRSIQTIYRRSMSREASLKDSLDQMIYQLSEMTNQANAQIKELSDKDVVISQLKVDKNGWMWKAIGTWIGMALILGGGLFFLIKR